MSHLCKALVLGLGVLILPAPASRAAEDEAIQRAIDRGLGYLRKSQRANGGWEYMGMGAAQAEAADVGTTALAAVTLLKCGANPDDRGIQKAAKYLRSACSELEYTYSIAACIMFFDNFGDPQDKTLIDVLTLRLIGGQLPNGTWSYNCPLAGEKELNLVRAAMERQSATGPKEKKPPEQTPPAEVPVVRRPPPSRVGGLEGGGIGRGQPGDHSNTQFACFALWIGRKRGLPVKDALKGVQDNLRLTQRDDGGWGYRTSADVNPSMICAGLIGLAVAYGYANELAIVGNAKPSKDGATAKRKALQEGTRDEGVRNGLRALGAIWDLAMVAPPPKPARVPGMPAPSPGPPVKTLHQSQNYFLWSLERVAVAYGLETIGNRNWYGEGAQLLLATQNQDGSWGNDFTGAVVETALGLLFLSRANLAPDLSATLKGKIKDPGVRKLHAGGTIGGRPRETDRKDRASKGNARRTLDDIARPRLSLDDPNSGDGLRRGTALNKDVDPEALRLSTQLVEASGEDQKGLLAKLRDTEGVVYTQALALAIPQLSGKMKTAAREALADRLAAVTVATLRDKLDDQDPEVRRAAALACAYKSDKQFIPKLIELLEDPETSVWPAAGAALRRLTNQDFGPEPHAGSAERATAVARWREWWSRQSGSDDKRSK
jgi:hypothetical protein